VSRQNVELIRGAYAEWAETGRPVYRILDPEIEWHTRADLPDSGVHRGHDGFGAVMREWVASFDDFHADIDDFIDGGDCVVVPMVLRGRVRGSKQEVSMHETWVWKVRNGMVVEIHEFPTLEEALKAVARLAE